MVAWKQVATCRTRYSPHRPVPTGLSQQLAGPCNCTAVCRKPATGEHRSSWCLDVWIPRGVNSMNRCYAPNMLAYAHPCLGAAAAVHVAAITLQDTSYLPTNWAAPPMPQSEGASRTGTLKRWKPAPADVPLAPAAASTAKQPPWSPNPLPRLSHAACMYRVGLAQMAPHTQPPALHAYSCTACMTDTLHTLHTLPFQHVRPPRLLRAWPFALAASKLALHLASMGRPPMVPRATTH